MFIIDIEQLKNKIFNQDCVSDNPNEGINKIPDKSINLAIYDPPYFSTGIKEVGDKQWKKEDDYIEWLINLIKETERVLKDNGSFYLFHNDADLMTDILYRIKHETKFKLKNQITWSKINNWKSANIKDGAGMFRSILQCYGSQRTYNSSTTEYIYYFTFDKNEYYSYTRKAINNIQQYLNTLITVEELANLMVENKICKNYNSAKQNSKNILNQSSFKPQFITEKQYNLIPKEKKPYKELNQEYEKMKQIYEKERYSFNQPEKIFKGKPIIDIREELKPYTTVWEYDRDHNIYEEHLTPKPLEMLEHIIKTSSNENDIILDCFMGSGTTAIACKNTNRNYIGFETNNTYYNKSLERINTYKN